MMTMMLVKQYNKQFLFLFYVVVCSSAGRTWLLRVKPFVFVEEKTWQVYSNGLLNDVMESSTSNWNIAQTHRVIFEQFRRRSRECREIQHNPHHQQTNKYIYMSPCGHIILQVGNSNISRNAQED